MAMRDDERGAPGMVASRLDEMISRMMRRTPEEIAEAQARALEGSLPARPLPEGKTWLDVVSGQWPGDESDDVVRAALDDLS